MRLIVRATALYLSSVLLGIAIGYVACQAILGELDRRRDERRQAVDAAICWLRSDGAGETANNLRRDGDWNGWELEG